LVWSVTPHADETRIITSKDGTWDLTHMDLMQEKVKLSGTVEYVPNALLSPQDFSKRDDFQLGQPGDAVQYATSRMHIKVPQGSYLICGYSVDFASRMYVNGTLVYEAGKPGSSRKQALPGVEYYVVPAVPDANGDIVIVQQVSNFTHKDGGTHGTLYLGAPRLINQYVTPEWQAFSDEPFVIPCSSDSVSNDYGYKPNLLFSLHGLSEQVRADGYLGCISTLS
ncbi:MAG: histidine kinase, partial [[Clostridium] innocuum]